MTNENGGHLVPGLRFWCLLVLCGLAFGPHPTAANITPTGIVNSVGPAGTTPIPPTIGDLVFGPEIEISLDNGQLIVDATSLLRIRTNCLAGRVQAESAASGNRNTNPSRLRSWQLSWRCSLQRRKWSVVASSTRRHELYVL